MSDSIHDTPHLAFSVCARCKVGKKRCNKLLPSCSRCSGLGVECIYTVTPTDKFSTSQSITSARFEKSLALRRSTTPIQFLPDNATDYSNLLQLPNILLANRSQKIAFQPLEFDSQLTAQVLSVLARDSLSLSTCCRAYFQTIAPRLPIVAEKEFFSRLSHFCTLPDADFSLLVACMALLARASLKPDVPNVPSTLYYTAKGFHALLASRAKTSLELVQAGLMLALFEYCQGLHEVAWVSIWTAAQMGYALGLDRCLGYDLRDVEASRSRTESGRCTWWGIFILERMLAIENLDNFRSFACQSPNLNDRLPLNMLAPDQILGSSGDSNMQIIPASSHHYQRSEYWLYAQAAQAAYLLHLVIEWIQDEITDPRTKQLEAENLDCSLQAFIVQLLQQPRLLDYDACGPYSQCVSALLALHEHKLLLEQTSWAATQDQISRTKLVISSTTKMAVQTMEMGPEKIMKAVLNFPFWTTQFLYKSAILMVNLDLSYESPEEQTRGVQIIRDAIDRFAKRWRILEQYAESIEKAIKSQYFAL